VAIPAAYAEAVRRRRDPSTVSQVRVVRFSVRSVLVVIGLVIAAWALLSILAITRQVITWILVSIFLALALNPAVEWFMRRGVKSRGAAAAITYLLALVAIAAIGYAFIPTLVNQVNDFVQALPGYVDDLTKGRGRLGFLQTKYHIVDKIREAVSSGGASKVLGLTGAAISITKSVIALVVATITIAFLTFFMLLEGPAWMERFYGLLPEASQPRWRKIGHDVYRAVGGYVTGNLLISLIAGTLTTVVLLAVGVPYAVALGVIVAIFDLIPLAGATIAAIIIGTVAFLHSITAGIVVVIFFIVYQQVENHFLQPVIYGRTVQLSPLAVLISVLIGAKLAGILGALGAIPIAGAIQVVLLDWQRHRRERLVVSQSEPLPERESPEIGKPDEGGSPDSL
jgi:predicted PurR-regulated permease PerM